MRNYLFLILFVATSLFLLPKHALARILTEDIVANHYELTMPEGDEGTLYLSTDGAMIFMPFITNNTYTTNCWAEWKFVPKTQRLLISDANRCSILNGAYRLEKNSNGFTIIDGGKKFILRKFHKL